MIEPDRRQIVLFKDEKKQPLNQFTEGISKALNALEEYEKIIDVNDEGEINETIEKLTEINDKIAELIDSEFQNDV